MSEDDIDAAALQARIDISMSFANDLVSSWIKTPKKAQPDRPWAEIQREMDEYARRPPRLGVGASAPESLTLSRETERLKSKLGKKRNRDESGEPNGLEGQTLSSDEEESRGNAARKKIKADPFGGRPKSKPSKNVLDPGPSRILASSLVSPHQPIIKSSADTDESDEPNADNATTTVGPSEKTSELPGTSSGKKKKKKKKHKLENGINGASTPSTPTSNATVSRNNHVPLHATPATPTKAIIFPSPQSLSKVPLLNLNGPPASDEDTKVDGSPSILPKKKRKRKKHKNKNKQNAGQGQTNDSHQHEGDP